VTVAASDANAFRGGADTGAFTVTRTGSTALALIVNYSLSGTAQNGSDYQQLAASVTIPAGSSSATITVTPIDDSSVEDRRDRRAHPFGTAAYIIGSPSSATITIADNDQPPPGEPVLTLSEFVPDASETGPVKGVIRFHRTGDTSQPIQVNWTFSGTAANGSDFEELPTTSPFPAGLAEADLTITPIDDSVVEGDETVIVTLVAGPGYTVAHPAAQPSPSPTTTSPRHRLQGDRRRLRCHRFGDGRHRRVHRQPHRRHRFGADGELRR